MIRIIVASSVALAFGAIVAHAQAPYPVLSQLGPYVTGQLGGSFPTEDPYNNSIAIGGGVGWRFTPMFRADTTFTYRPDLGPNFGPSMSNWTGMVNGYVDLNTVHLGAFVPYVKAGLGFAENTVDRGFGTADHFAWDFGGGLSYALSDHTAVDLDYQYISMGSATTIPEALHANEVKLGLRYGF